MDKIIIGFVHIFQLMTIHFCKFRVENMQLSTET